MPANPATGAARLIVSRYEPIDRTDR
ncbi:protein of unknown function [Cupriavidus neocaledonicus]|uniref:Uncharacterized protein n=1 Tax=Cupriavidus neocaledonicus TaxID=1040979 RepID=A0A375H9I4_9BURK|nr:hypothetical protein CBM2605_A140015 [Cupriavidus neocaledonicus]SPD46850.1 protein of unknown function [Cupriavidus neocaledonicus]